jgi:hypothetical protein
MGRGAVLLVPHDGGHREYAIQTKVFEKYIRDNVVSWFNWSKDKGLPVERIEDLVLVYGCTMVTSWAAAAFDDYAAEAQVSLATRTLDNRGASFHWNNYRGTVDYHDSQLELLDPVCSLLVTVTRRSLTFLCFTKRMVHAHGRISVSSSSASEQSASCSGPNTSEPRQDLFLTTLIIVKRMRYK